MWYFPILLPCVVSLNKKKNINNDLVILPSYDTTAFLSFLIPRIFITHSMGQLCCSFYLHYLSSILWFLTFFFFFLDYCHGLNHDPELSRILPKISQHTWSMHWFSQYILALFFHRQNFNQLLLLLPNLLWS